MFCFNMLSHRKTERGARGHSRAAREKREGKAQGLYILL